jgi:hypothetical protein
MDQSTRTFLNPAKEAHWKSGSIFTIKNVVEGRVSQPVYIQHLMCPEGYAIEKDGNMFYGFYLPAETQPRPSRI